MGDPSDFYSGRSPNMRTVLRVTYKSGRVEEYDYNTRQIAERDRLNFMALGTVKRATILKNKIHPKQEVSV